MTAMAGLAMTAILIGVGAGVYLFPPIAALPASPWAPGAVSRKLAGGKHHVWR